MTSQTRIYKPNAVAAQLLLHAQVVVAHVAAAATAVSVSQGLGWGVEMARNMASPAKLVA